ncbi:hypothetical protein D3C85_1213070 [compost metagenome]
MNRPEGPGHRNLITTQHRQTSFAHVLDEFGGRTGVDGLKVTIICSQCADLELGNSASGFDPGRVRGVTPLGQDMAQVNRDGRVLTGHLVQQQQIR